MSVEHTGNCEECGAPIFASPTVQGAEESAKTVSRSCPASCQHGPGTAFIDEEDTDDAD